MRLKIIVWTCLVLSLCFASEAEPIDPYAGTLIRCLPSTHPDPSRPWLAHRRTCFRA